MQQSIDNDDQSVAGRAAPRHNRISMTGSVRASRDYAAAQMIQPLTTFGRRFSRYVI